LLSKEDYVCSGTEEKGWPFPPLRLRRKTLQFSPLMRDRTEGEREGERGREKKSRRDNGTSVFQLSRSFV